MNMTAIILAAGVGKRFGEELRQRPKALLEVDGEALIERLVRQLNRAGVSRIVIVVGYRADMMEKALAGAKNVTLVTNPDFTRGAILSLWSAREYLAGPVVVMDADVFIPFAMLDRLLKSANESCFLLDGRVPPTGEEQMLMVRGGRVFDIARIPRGEYDGLGESVGFLKLSAEGTAVLHELLATRVAGGDRDLEHEEVYPELLQRVVVGFERVDDLDWTEIDFPGDLERARSLARGLAG